MPEAKRGLYASAAFFADHDGEIARIERESGAAFERIAVPESGPLDAAVLDRIEIGFFSSDVIGSPLARPFYGALRRAPRLRWLHVAHAGTDAPIYAELLARGVRITTSSGDTAVPIAQTAITGLLMLARGFPRWIDGQRRHAWEEHPGNALPADLEGQTLLLVGVGAIGNEIGRLAQALGMRVVGVRRSAQRPGDHVDELHPPSALPALYPRADWLAIASPLTDETRGLIDAAALAALPAGARVLNVARGAIIDEPALIDALRSGHLGGAYLDVMQEEPLPAGSPLWDLPNVILTPHNSSASSGNAGRLDARFLRNLERWARGEPLDQEVTG
jgi:phosphoglycerate dehydrogenase-like enzyme